MMSVPSGLYLESSCAREYDEHWWFHNGHLHEQCLQSAHFSKNGPAWPGQTTNVMLNIGKAYQYRCSPSGSLAIRGFRS